VTNRMEASFRRMGLDVLVLNQKRHKARLGTLNRVSGEKPKLVNLIDEIDCLSISGTLANQGFSGFGCAECFYDAKVKDRSEFHLGTLWGKSLSVARIYWIYF
jgi:hypothetical protein